MGCFYIDLHRNEMAKNKSPVAKLAFKFVLIVGIVNLFADMTYEGARSITGPFLESLGASVLAVGVIAGGGELLGYVLRSIAGYVADKTHKYWVVIIAGYVINRCATDICKPYEKCNGTDKRTGLCSSIVVAISIACDAAQVLIRETMRFA